jgi:hypothetical protein
LIEKYLRKNRTEQPVDFHNQSDSWLDKTTVDFRKKCSIPRDANRYDVFSGTEINCSEPSIYTASTQSKSRVLIKKYRQKRIRPSKAGYSVKRVVKFLSKSSLSNPANIPVVLSNSTILYQTRVGYDQVEISLPLGMIVNSVFLNQNWLYVQTPHGEEGYVNSSSCLLLGTIPSRRYGFFLANFIFVTFFILMFAIGQVLLLKQSA